MKFEKMDSVGLRTPLQIALICGILLINVPISSSTLSDCFNCGKKVYEPSTYLNIHEMDNESSIIKYKFTILAFYGAMNSTLDAEEKQQIEVSKNLSKFQAGKSEESDENFKTLQGLASKAVEKFKNVFEGRTKYGLIAYRYRLMMWLKYNMRRDERPNQILEHQIDTILNNLEMSESIRKLLSNIYPVEKIKKECLEIYTYDKLKEFGVEQDRIAQVYLDIAEHLKEEDNIMEEPQKKGLECRIAKEDYKMPPFQDISLKKYEEFLEEANKWKTDDRLIAEKDPLDIAVYIFDAAKRDQTFGIHEFNTNKIQLNSGVTIAETPTKESMKYFCDVLTIFKKVVQAKLNVQPTKKITIEAVMLGNYLLDNTNYMDLRKAALYHLGESLVKNYDEEINTIQCRPMWDFNHKKCYCEMLRWTRAHLQTINAPTKYLDDISRYPRASCSLPRGVKYENENKYLNENEYLNVTKEEDLSKICDDILHIPDPNSSSSDSSDDTWGRNRNRSKYRNDYSRRHHWDKYPKHNVF